MERCCFKYVVLNKEDYWHSKITLKATHYGYKTDLWISHPTRQCVLRKYIIT